MRFTISSTVRSLLTAALLGTLSGLAACSETAAPAPGAPTATASPEAPAAAPTAAPADTSPTAALRSPAPEGAMAYIIEPADGATVTSPLRVLFGLRGMGVAPAGHDAKHSGHHHLLINEPDYDPDLPLPATEQIIHFGAGQTETTVELEPGEHRLQLVLGNHLHIPHLPPVQSEVITVTVAAGP
ncbi:MAG: DUF4399 domain-containing protein [Pseudomonadota bacterium]